MGNTLIFGAAGQLGQCLAYAGQQRQMPGLIFLDEHEGNILEPAGLAALFAWHRPAYVINCAAYTAVDKAEDEEALAYRINCEGVENMARCCAAHGSVLIQISTDFVFAGTGNAPLRETDPAHPLSVYGRTKLAGEAIIPTLTDRYFILRTSWLYSEFAGNFLKTMLRLGTERPELRVVWDQLGTPTYGVDLAGCILHIIQSQSPDFGLYHYSNEGVASWYDFAAAIFELAEMSVKTLPIRTAEFPTKATRPAYSVLDKTKLKTTLGLAIPHWRSSLKTCLARALAPADV